MYCTMYAVCLSNLLYHAPILCCAVPLRNVLDLYHALKKYAVQSEKHAVLLYLTSVLYCCT